MKPAKLAALITIVLLLTLAVSAQLPQQSRPQTGQPQINDDRLEAAHEQLFSN